MADDIRDELPKLEQLRTTAKRSPELPAPGQPTKLTPKVQQALIEALSVGCYIETAVCYVGISKDSFHTWLRQGAQDLADGKRTKFSKFSDAVRLAMSEFEVKTLVQLGESAKSQESAARWLLERKFPKRWGQPGSRVELTGKEGGPIESRNEHVITPESLALASAIARMLQSLVVHPDPVSGGREDIEAHGDHGSREGDSVA